MNDIDQIREAYRALEEGQPADLIGRLAARIGSGQCYYGKDDEALDREAIVAIATARNDALEEAAKVATRRRKEAMKSSNPESIIREDEAEEICVLIRALKSD